MRVWSAVTENAKPAQDPGTVRRLRGKDHRRAEECLASKAKGEDARGVENGIEGIGKGTTTVNADVKQFVKQMAEALEDLSPIDAAEAVADGILQHATKAILDEREACAKIAVKLEQQAVADAIRSRPTMKMEG